jgi:hypothetical protein
VYEYINKNGGWENFSMIEIEKYPCNDKNEARAKERFWFEELNATLNTRKPASSEDEKKDWDKQYREKNKEKLLSYKHQYDEKNKDKINEKQKQYYKQKKEKLKESRENKEIDS